MPKLRKVTEEELMEMSESSKEVVHSGKYNNSTKLEFVCEKHGIYIQSLGHHRYGQGCPECGRERSVNMAAEKRRKDNPLPDWFVESLSDKHKEELKNGTYKRRGLKTFVCKEHGEYTMCHDVRLKGGECPICTKIRLNGYTARRRIESIKRYTYAQLEDARKSPDSDKFFNGLLGQKDKMTFVCDEHGEYQQTLSEHFKNGHVCPKCALVRQGKTFSENYRRRKGFDTDFLVALKGSPDEKKFLGFGLSLEDKVQLTCPMHGTYFQSYHQFITGHRCQQCGFDLAGEKVSKSAREKNPFPQWFVEDLEGSPDKESVLSRRLRIADSALFNCKIHGLYEQEIRGHLYGRKCPKCFSGRKSSRLEDSVAEWFTEHHPDIRILRNVRNYFGDEKSQSELDIVFPDYKVAVEIDGIFWHSYEKLVSKNVEDPKHYHLRKTEMCWRHAFQLVHLFDDSLNNNFELCMDLIVSKLVVHGYKDEREKVFARKCKVDFVSVDEAKEFYDRNHIQGYGDGKAYGLYYNGELLSCMSFRKCARNTSDIGSWCLTRYACKRGNHVVGGFERLFKHFLKDSGCRRVVSFADIGVSDGSLYERNGWRKCGDVPVDYFYVYNGRREHKFKFRLERFKNDEELYYEEGLTEFELAELNYIPRVYDCGKVKYEYVL